MEWREREEGQSKERMEMDRIGEGVGEEWGVKEASTLFIRIMIIITTYCYPSHLVSPRVLGMTRMLLYGS
jgi:hypothetical protein